MSQRVSSTRTVGTATVSTKPPTKPIGTGSMRPTAPLVNRAAASAVVSSSSKPGPSTAGKGKEPLRDPVKEPPKESAAKETKAAKDQKEERDLEIEEQARAAIFSLFTQLGKALREFSQYRCKKAIECFSELSLSQYDTAWVLVHVARAYFEMSDYANAEKFFKQARAVDPYHLQGLEYYSTLLWHSRKASGFFCVSWEPLKKNFGSYV